MTAAVAQLWPRRPEGDTVSLDAEPPDRAAHQRPAAVRLVTEIRRLRHAAKLTQAELANRIGYSPAYISLAERAGKGLPSGRVVEAIDHGLGAAGRLVALRTCAETERRALRARAARTTGNGRGTGLKLTVLVPAPASDTAALAGFWRELARQATRMACALDPSLTVQPTPF